jgi:hypothetical protein
MRFGCGLLGINRLPYTTIDKPSYSASWILEALIIPVAHYPATAAPDAVLTPHIHDGQHAE